MLVSLVAARRRVRIVVVYDLDDLLLNNRRRLQLQLSRLRIARRPQMVVIKRHFRFVNRLLQLLASGRFRLVNGEVLEIICEESDGISGT